MNVERMEDDSLMFYDCEYENEILLVQDNKDPYGVKPVALATVGDYGYDKRFRVVGLSVTQINDLIKELQSIVKKYE